MSNKISPIKCIGKVFFYKDKTIRCAIMQNDRWIVVEDVCDIFHITEEYFDSLVNTKLVHKDGTKFMNMNGGYISFKDDGYVKKYRVMNECAFNYILMSMIAGKRPESSECKFGVWVCESMVW